MRTSSSVCTGGCTNWIRSSVSPADAVAAGGGGGGGGADFGFHLVNIL